MAPASDRGGKESNNDAVTRGTSRSGHDVAWPHLFDWPDDLLAGKTLTTPPSVRAQLRVSVPERAVLEMLYEVGTHQSLEEAHNLFGSLRNLRKDVLTRLLECCTSVKTVRLFLTWARETGIIDVAALQQRPLPVGSNKRWMTRMKDGTLLTLKPIDSAYAQAVRLLLTVAPDVFASDLFAMKGGTAINLFVRDMPRLSVDIDVAYTAWQTPREQALREITAELDATSPRLMELGPP